MGRRSLGAGDGRSVDRQAIPKMMMSEEVQESKPMTKQNWELVPRWRAVIHYLSESGSIDVVHEIEELEELQEIVEPGRVFRRSRRSKSSTSWVMSC
jgi:hypothetical protein